MREREALYNYTRGQILLFFTKDLPHVLNSYGPTQPWKVELANLVVEHRQGRTEGFVTSLELRRCLYKCKFCYRLTA